MILQPNANLDNDGNHIDVLNILLVDDDRNLATTLSHGLRKAMGKASSVVFCSSGPEALAMLATQSFDVVISDFHMPGMSGLELLKKIRQDHCETILLLITAYGTDTLEEEVHRLGIGYVTKPFEMPILSQSIHGLMRGKDSPRISAPEDNANPSRFVSNTE